MPARTFADTLLGQNRGFSGTLCGDALEEAAGNRGGASRAGGSRAGGGRREAGGGRRGARCQPATLLAPVATRPACSQQLADLLKYASCGPAAQETQLQETPEP